jgi:two-component system OmpR family response regulator
MSIQVLLVDDEKEFAAYTAKRLSARGMQVRITHSGSSALELIAGHSFDVIVLDLLMPGMNGLEVLREMKKARSEAQVIMLSGHMNREAVTAGESLGAVEYILKPCEFSTLLKAIENADKRKPPRPEAE